jgi:hypothetical protein
VKRYRTRHPAVLGRPARGLRAILHYRLKRSGAEPWCSTKHEERDDDGLRELLRLDAILGDGWTAGGWLSLLVAALIVSAIVLALRPRGPAADDPRGILRRRFARGEIVAEELAQAQRALGS